MIYPMVSFSVTLSDP